VTGATGVLGRVIVRQLAARSRDDVERETRSPTGFSSVQLESARSRSGHPRVHVLVRASSEREALDGLDVRWHLGDLCDAASIDSVVRDAARAAHAAGRTLSIVHSAALVSYKTSDRVRARAVNVGGTRVMLASAVRSGIARFAFVSSVVTVAHSIRGEVLDERASFNSARLGVDYFDTKRAAEDLALGAARDLDVVVVNPGVIFGPVDRISNTVRFIRELAIGRPPPLAPPGSVSVVGVEDAARGALLALERGRRGERYVLVESHFSTHELLNEIARALRVAPVRRRSPHSAWRAIELCASAIDRVMPLEALPPQALRALGVDLRFDAAKARRELGWNPEPFRAVLQRTIAHLRSRGLLDAAPQGEGRD
jgi:nucleoside-diphosphate-sugar epimerase